MLLQVPSPQRTAGLSSPHPTTSNATVPSARHPRIVHLTATRSRSRPLGPRVVRASAVHPFERRRRPQYQLVRPAAAHELQADRQAVDLPHRYRDRRLPGQVERTRVPQVWGFGEPNGRDGCGVAGDTSRSSSSIARSTWPISSARRPSASL
ncbi:MAG: hypothetical protein MZV70_00235 [Desulfobacterales bacterium]|nr:hypothetical protein [Desulfobacterales bacterium]